MVGVGGESVRDKEIEKWRRKMISQQEQQDEY